MSEYCVVVAEVARARIYTLEESEVPDFDGGPNLVERTTLANPHHQGKEDDRLADTRRGAGKEFVASQESTNQTTGIPHHNYDDHREDYERKMNQSFARDLVEEVDRMVQTNGIRHVVLCAEPQMLGYLRPEMKGHLNRVQLDEVAKDLVEVSPHDLHNRLAKEGHLPPRKTGVGAPPSNHR